MATFYIAADFRFMLGTYIYYKNFIMHPAGNVAVHLFFAEWSLKVLQQKDLLWPNLDISSTFFFFMGLFKEARIPPKYQMHCNVIWIVHTGLP